MNVSECRGSSMRCVVPPAPSQARHGDRHGGGPRFWQSRRAPYERRIVVIAWAEGCNGAVARYLGLLATTMQRRDDGARHFEDVLAIRAALGAWPQLAHTQRDYAAMLRARGAPEDEARAAALQAAARARYA